MAWKNNNILAQSSGTLEDFLLSLKATILDNTDFSFDEDSSDIYQIVFDTNIGNVKLQISDNNISIDNPTATSQKLQIVFYDKILGTTYLNKNGFVYGNTSSPASTMTERKVNVKFTNLNGFFGLCFASYREEPITLNDCCLYKIVGNDFYGAKQDMFLISTSGASQTNAIHSCYGSNNGKCTLNRFINTTADGIVMENATFSNVDTNTIKGYIDGLYNCSTISAGYHYMINGKQYYALTDNYILKL